MFSLNFSLLTPEPEPPKWSHMHHQYIWRTLKPSFLEAQATQKTLNLAYLIVQAHNSIFTHVQCDGIIHGILVEVLTKIRHLVFIVQWLVNIQLAVQGWSNTPYDLCAKLVNKILIDSFARVKILNAIIRGTGRIHFFIRFALDKNKDYGHSEHSM